MLHGDCMSLMMTMPEASYDAVITDPPYASGGLSTAARAQDPRVKYQQSGTRKYYPTFSNDTRDQRTHLMWSVRWMEQALRLTRPGGWLMVFSDWRQLPLTSDALQIAGSGTTLVAARNKGHTAVGIELSPDYHRIASDRLGLVLTA